MRFSDEEWERVTKRAAMAELAVGAWIGQVSVEAAEGRGSAAGLPDLLCLHTDVQRLQSVAAADELAALVRRLDVAVDAVVAEIERGRR